MRFFLKNKHHDTRVVEKFAWLPIIITEWDQRETRWLEKVKIRQQWFAFGDDIRIAIFGGYWKNVCFED